MLRNWGLEPGRLHVMRNGVDLARFRPLPQASARQALGLSGGPILLSVGHLVERKGHHLAIDALARSLTVFPEARLVVIGDGEERQNLERQVRELSIEAHVHLSLIHI